MRRIILKATIICVLLLVSLTCFSQQAQTSAAELQTIAQQAYIFAYPLILMDLTRRSMTMDGSLAFINAFAHLPFFPDEHFRQVIRPNADTLYSNVWLDLSGGPVLLHVPDTQGRYYVLQLMDAWSDTFVSLGKRTTGTAEAWFAIAGPGWQGELPSGVKRIDSPTNTVWLLGRTQTNGVSDYDRVHAIQGGYQLAPLSKYPQVQPPLGLFELAALRERAAARPPEQALRMSVVEFFRAFAALLKNNPPHPDDAPMMQRLAKMGITPGKPFDPDALGPERMKAIEKGAAEASALVERWAKPDSQKSCWGRAPKAGRYGTDYTARAFTARNLLGANPPEDAVYLGCRQDAAGQPLTGAKNYVLHFAKREVPRVRAFWSLTLYDEAGYFVANPLHRFAIGDRDPLKFDPDGSLDLYIQHGSPGSDKESNWLPAPEGNFNLSLRFYWPDENIIKGDYKPPLVKPVSAANQ